MDTNREFSSIVGKIAVTVTILYSLTSGCNSVAKCVHLYITTSDIQDYNFPNGKV